MYFYLILQHMSRVKQRRFLQIQQLKLQLWTLYFRNSHDTNLKNKNKKPLSKKSFLGKKQRLSFPSTGRKMQDFSALHHLTKMQQYWPYGTVQAMLGDFWTGPLTNTHNLVNYRQPLICQLMFIGNRNRENEKQQHGRELIHNMQFPSPHTASLRGNLRPHHLFRDLVCGKFRMVRSQNVSGICVCLCVTQ